MAQAHDLKIDVYGDGAFGCEIAIVGEAPGETEVQTKVPFSGGAGKILWDELRKQGYNRAMVYTTNVVKRQLSMSKHTSERSPIHTSELAHWIELVRWELAQLPNLKLILLLGNYALNAVVGKDKITNWRGSIFDNNLLNRQVRCLASFNPAMVRHDPSTEILFKFDIAKVSRVMLGKYKPYTVTAYYNLSFSDACDAIRGVHEQGTAGRPVSFDIETLSLETACIGIATDPHEGFCINFRDQRRNIYTREQERELRLLFQRMFLDDRIKFVAQNGSFDCYWLWYKDRIRVHRVWFDTLLAHHTLFPTLPHNLGALTTQYTDHPYYKDEGKEWKDNNEIDSFWLYNVKDVCLTLAVSEYEQRELEAAQLSSFFHNHVMRLQPKLVRATVLGILCDTELKQHITEAVRADVAELMRVFHDKVHAVTALPEYYPNPNSWPQVAELLFAKLKLVGRGTSTNDENRQRIKRHPRTSPAAVEMLDALDRYKEEHKFLSTYAEMVIDGDSRIRCEYKQYGTQSAPGRLSSTKTLWGSGMNLQNQPKRAHAMFVADKGYAFIYFDLAQAEARYVAWDAWIPLWIEQFERARADGSYDAHRALASDLFEVSYDDVPAKDHDSAGRHTIRYIAKRCRHGLNYRMAADRLATVTGLSPSEAQFAYDVYHRKTPELRIWWDRLVAEVRQSKALYNSLGRRLLFLNRLSDEHALDAVVAFRPQSTIGDKVSQVWYESEDDPRWPNNSRIVLNVHDALVGLAPIHKAKTCLAIMKEYAEKPIMVRSTVTGKTNPMIIPAETKISYPTNWAIDDSGKLVFVEDGRGMHRWSHMRVVEV
ncbi:hypothetical protein HC928_00500 [bacterium]|nr:hypothetical protein [bacterium]